MQKRRQKCDPQSLADMRLVAEEICRQRRLPMAGRQGVQGAKTKREACHSQSAGSQLSRQGAHDFALQLTEPDDDPIGHHQHGRGNEIGWLIRLALGMVIA